ncbi:PAAR repeat-containing protein [Vibrio phage vB_pir03]|nr:PAAR repeat-containing protein [Vibrio phage vB_pir03]
MGKPASSGTQPCTGHGCFPPSTVTGTSPDVTINGQPAMLAGDPMAPHTCVRKPYPTHGSTIVGGSGTVLINGKPSVRIGDPVGCGSAVAGGSSDVFIGG